MSELVAALRSHRAQLDQSSCASANTGLVAAVRSQIEHLAARQQLDACADCIRADYADCFPEDIPHVRNLPDDVFHRFRLKDPEKPLKVRQYGCPRKWLQPWQTLLQQHLDAGRIRPSDSPFVSPAFIIPKKDPAALPRWVNDYRQLNENTVPDNHPLPHVDDILNDCGKGKLFTVIDMTNSFFQTRVHPDDIKYTAVSTPFGMYEWTVMPMGCRNAPATHQRRMFSALRHLIGKVCHVYMDDIVVWSSTDHAEHEENLRQVLNAIRAAGLYCSNKKTAMFQTEVQFLGHHISARGIEADKAKVAKILDWPRPKTTTEVRSFLGLVRYIAVFLPKLAQHTAVLTPLTTKEADKVFPPWNEQHNTAFSAVKELVVSRECLTTIDHENLGNNRVYVTCDASDIGIGATLSVGRTWEAARPVAFDSMQLKGAQLNYPVHEKELLAIVSALQKWRVDLLGTPFTVYTDHRTLTCFNSQRDLSRRQMQWQELLSQYDFTIEYIKGEDNTVADALSRRSHEDSSLTSVTSVLTVTADQGLLKHIRAGYKDDPFCAKLLLDGMKNLGAHMDNGLIFIHDRLVIPRVGDLREVFFRLAHDSLGHYGINKMYASLCNAYYWPNMRKELETGYVPSCDECQQNKSSTAKAAGPLHPLPIPDKRGDSVTIDFVGPLPEDHGFNRVVTFTDRLGSDVRIAPCTTNLTAEKFVSIFFDVWYCENGLPTEIISDRDALFTSKFWSALHKLTGVKLKMSTAFHPETNGLSERTNKTFIQALRYHIMRNQSGWLRALPCVRFDLLNTVNASTGFSPFQLRMGRSPRIVPPLVEDVSAAPPSPEDVRANALYRQLKLDCAEAKDNLILAKVSQAIQADKHRGPEHRYSKGDFVMLKTLHRRHEYMSKGNNRVAKFMPRWDGKYKVIEAWPETSVYRIEMPNSPNVFNTFHASEFKPYHSNDPSLFPGRELSRPPAVITEDGLEEWVINCIEDELRRGRGKQYLVRYLGYGDDERR